MNRLGIVIPAYKEMFFNAALTSLSNQTNKEFTVYIGDDNSPHHLKAISDKFTDSIKIRYTRFDDNVGAKNLVNQWSRCIQLTEGEEWIWLFSDDDLVDNNCVQNFYDKMNLDRGAYDIYRFNNVVIDKDDNVLWATPQSPSFENSEEMAYNLLLGKRGNSLADHIFSREIYNLSGGLVYTKFAQGADWALSILFSKRTGIAIIPDAKFYWRISGDNISSKVFKIRNNAMEGHLQFIEWIADHFDYLKRTHSTITYEMMMEAARHNLVTNIIHHYKGFDSRSTMQLVQFFHRVFHFSYFKCLKILLFIKKETSLKTNHLYRVFRKIRGIKIERGIAN